MWRRRAWLLTGLLVVLACGSRTGLLFDGEQPAPPEDAGAEIDATLRDAERDAPRPFDAGFDAPEDALPQVDVRPPNDAYINNCPDAAATLIYVITLKNDLLSFDPTTGAFNEIGPISCPTGDPTATPFSMAVDRQGIARIIFQSGTAGMGAAGLYRVSTATAACEGTPFISNQQGITTFGMSFVGDQDAGGETLFVASDPSSPTPNVLASIDSTYALSQVGPFSPSIPGNGAELTGTGAGQLFAFYSQCTNGVGGVMPCPGSYIAEIDKTNANVISQTFLNGVDQGNGWAFGFWGGDFYLFTSADGASSQVTRYRPSDGSITVVGSLPEVIVGAGVSTCAPQH